ncbi:hypothetical protein BJV43_003035 [Clostridium saccharoperbutylacetonicum]|nr:hypothetical protein [Clostridium saccharoperbutylacetonicum]
MKKLFIYTTSLIITPILILILMTFINLSKLPDKIYTKDEKTVQSLAPIGNTINKVKNEKINMKLNF